MAKKYDDLGEGIHRIERGLYIRKRSGRPTTWLLICSIAGKRKEIRLGLLDEMGISAARAQADKARALIEQGIDPVSQRREARAALAASPRAAYRFKDLLEEALPIIARAKRWRNTKSEAQWRASLEAYALPHLGEKLVAEISRSDILEALQPIWESKTETASRTRMRIEALFAYAIASGRYSGQNPATWRGNLDFFLAAPGKIKKKAHFEALPVQAVRDLLAETNWNNPPIGWACIAFCALAACRVNEGARARWDEIDLEVKVWSCPRRKDGKDYPHRVPLSRQMVALLERLPHDSDYLFPGQGARKGSHLSLETPRALIIKRAGAGTMHGFRSTFRDWAAEHGIDRVLAEKSLMHATGTEVERAYQRSDLLEQRRPVMQAWADEIMPMDD